MFRISEFAKLSRISARMLRHYDELGLFRPYCIDAENGYRYYSTDQLWQLQRILAFQDMGLSLFEIAQLQNANLGHEALHHLLSQKLQALETDLERRKIQIRKLKARLKTLPNTEYEVLVRQIKPLLVASKCAPIGVDLEPTLTELEQFAAKHQARAANPPLALHHENAIEAAIPLRFSIAQTRNIAVYRLEPVQKMACVVHCGAYQTLPNATKALFEWVKTNGFVAIGALREVYLRFGADEKLGLPQRFLTTNSSEFVTELQLPIQ